MKKLKFEWKLKLNKETITKLKDEQMKDLKGGAQVFTTGCTDGCAPLRKLGMCSFTNCTADCSHGSMYTCMD